ncbi:hypothetical protein BpHYR1_030529 [Brachionus plicatilis]|uniref:Uncharacterized protein n=1 Tax=Brachionus plicatilis TaxID=10195 RepID=A0A3M7S102_BRAPC|nr:hypothetical protein BpHYR1_030529 [Brachionus plicatilis]
MQILMIRQVTTEKFLKIFIFSNLLRYYKYCRADISLSCEHVQNRMRRRKRRERKKIIDVIYVKFGKHFNKLNKVCFSVKELINLEKKKENVNSPKELNPRLPGTQNLKDKT